MALSSSNLACSNSWYSMLLPVCASSRFVFFTLRPSFRIWSNKSWIPDSRRRKNNKIKKVQINWLGSRARANKIKSRVRLWWEKEEKERKKLKTFVLINFNKLSRKNSNLKWKALFFLLFLSENWNKKNEIGFVGSCKIGLIEIN